MVKIRLQRIGKKKYPIYRIIVIDSRYSRNGGKVIEFVGLYDPMNQNSNLNIKNIKLNRINYWLSVGAQPTITVKNILKKANKL